MRTVPNYKVYSIWEKQLNPWNDHRSGFLRTDWLSLWYVVTGTTSCSTPMVIQRIQLLLRMPNTIPNQLVHSY